MPITVVPLIVVDASEVDRRTLDRFRARMSHRYAAGRVTIQHARPDQPGFETRALVAVDPTTEEILGEVCWRLLGSADIPQGWLAVFDDLVIADGAPSATMETLCFVAAGVLRSRFSVDASSIPERLKSTGLVVAMQAARIPVLCTC